MYETIIMAILIMLKSKTESEFIGIFNLLSRLSSPGAPNIFSMSPNIKKMKTNVNDITFIINTLFFMICLIFDIPLC
jgi:hypothetical protein